MPGIKFKSGYVTGNRRTTVQVYATAPKASVDKVTLMAAEVAHDQFPGHTVGMPYVESASGTSFKVAVDVENVDYDDACAVEGRRRR